MKDQANLITGSFDVVVSKLGCLSTAVKNRESVREITEGPADSATTNDAAIASGSGQFAHVTSQYCSGKGHIARFICKKEGGTRS